MLWRVSPTPLPIALGRLSDLITIVELASCFLSWYPSSIFWLLSLDITALAFGGCLIKDASFCCLWGVPCENTGSVILPQKCALLRVTESREWKHLVICMHPCQEDERYECSIHSAQSTLQILKSPLQSNEQNRPQLGKVPRKVTLGHFS